MTRRQSVQKVSTVQVTELTFMQNVRMVHTVVRERDTLETVQQASSDQVTLQTLTSWQVVVVVEEVSTLTKVPTGVKIAGQATSAMAMPPSQTQRTQEEMEERFAQQDTTAHGDLTQPLLAQLVTSIQMKELV